MNAYPMLDPNPGGKPSVLLLHGLGADGNSWQLQLPALCEAGLRPLAPDIPGFGNAGYDGRGWTVRRVAREMAEIIRQPGIGSAHVVGLSLGGVIAQQLARDHPHLVQKLILVSTFSALKLIRGENRGYFFRRAWAVLTQGVEVQAEIVAGRIFPRPEDLVLKQMLMESISRADPRAYRAAMIALAGFDSRSWLNELHHPTLVMAGEADSSIPAAEQEYLAGAIEGARFELIRNAGHAMPIDQPDLFNRILIDFLQSDQERPGGQYLNSMTS